MSRYRIYGTTVSPVWRMGSRPTYSCNRCVARKVKCNRERPCRACVRHNVDCIFTPPPIPQRQKRVKDQVLTDRLRRYEALLQEHGIEPSKPPETPQSDLGSGSSEAVSSAIPTPRSIESASSRHFDDAQAVPGQGRAKYVTNRVCLVL